MAEPTSAQVPRSHRASRRRGETSRKALLAAVLRVIARAGVRGVTIILRREDLRRALQSLGDVPIVRVGQETLASNP